MFILTGDIWSLHSPSLAWHSQQDRCDYDVPDNCGVVWCGVVWWCGVVPGQPSTGGGEDYKVPG